MYFCYFLSWTKWKTVLNTPSCLCISSFSLPRYYVLHGPFEVQNVGQHFCFDLLGGVALASFDPQLATRLVHHGIWHQILKIILSPIIIEHPQNASNWLFHCFSLLTITVDAFISVVDCFPWLCFIPTFLFIWINQLPRDRYVKQIFFIRKNHLTSWIVLLYFLNCVAFAALIRKNICSVVRMWEKLHHLQFLSPLLHLNYVSLLPPQSKHPA